MAEKLSPWRSSSKNRLKEEFNQRLRSPRAQSSRKEMSSTAVGELIAS